MEINEKTKFSQVLTGKNLKEVRNYVMYLNLPIGQGAPAGQSPEGFHKHSPTWGVEGMTYGLKRLGELADTQVVHHIYRKEECKDDKQKKNVVLMHFPAKEAGPFMVIIPGGGYTCVCAAAEGFSTAARLNALGINCFLLNYRIGGDGLFPKPMDDLAAAITYIRNHSQELCVDKERYGVCGFSAGGNLCCNWGTENHGYLAYNLPKPEVMFPVYPVVGGEELIGPEEKDIIHNTILGKGFSREKYDEYDDFLHMDSFPPCYIVACKDDDTVPPTQSIRLSEELSKRNIPNVLEMGEHGGHGFGDGSATDVAGWTSRAVEFWKKNTAK